MSNEPANGHMHALVWMVPALLMCLGGADLADALVVVTLVDGCCLVGLCLAEVLSQLAAAQKHLSVDHEIISRQSRMRTSSARSFLSGPKTISRTSLSLWAKSPLCRYLCRAKGDQTTSRDFRAEGVGFSPGFKVCLLCAQILSHATGVVHVVARAAV